MIDTSKGITLQPGGDRDALRVLRFGDFEATRHHYADCDKVEYSWRCCH
jgi:hypothetical protein